MPRRRALAGGVGRPLPGNRPAASHPPPGRWLSAPLSKELRVVGRSATAWWRSCVCGATWGTSGPLPWARPYVHDRIPCDAMLVMDADGEDRPRDAVRLVEQYLQLQGRKNCVCGAHAPQRVEALPGPLPIVSAYALAPDRDSRAGGELQCRAGDFLPTLVTVPEMWNHYAAAVFQSRLPFTMISTERGARYSGSSKMNYLSLIMHGLHAISVFSALVAVRLLLAVFALSCVCGAFLLGVSSRPGVRLQGWLWRFLRLGRVRVAAAPHPGLLFARAQPALSAEHSQLHPVRDYIYFVESLFRSNPRRLGPSSQNFPSRSRGFRRRSCRGRSQPAPIGDRTRVED